MNEWGELRHADPDNGFGDGETDVAFGSHCAERDSPPGGSAKSPAGEACYGPPRPPTAANTCPVE